MNVYYSNFIQVFKTNWLIKRENNESLSLLKSKFSFSETVASIISKRTEKEDVENYINPKIKNLLLNPLILNDLEVGVRIVIQKIFENQKIVIYGDYDVDGATSVALFVHYFRMINFSSFDFFIPKRSDGYGLNLNDIKKIYEEGADLIIAVDCGTLSFNEIEYINGINKKIIVIDHHSSEKTLPKADALINPHRFDQKLDEKNKYLKDLSAAGVVFMFLVALQEGLRNKKFFNKEKFMENEAKEASNENSFDFKAHEPNLMFLLDLVALGTVLDVMPLTNLNRAFVKCALKMINNEMTSLKINENEFNSKNDDNFINKEEKKLNAVKNEKMNSGIIEIINELEINEKINVYHLAFLIGPRINASGRINDVTLGTQLLTENSKIRLQKIAKELHEINSERQKIEKKILEEATKLIEKNKLHELPIIIIKGKGWHHGVVGIVASRIKDKFYRPVIICEEMEEFVRGSARSIQNFNFGEMIHEAKKLNLLISGGGHKMAGGLSVHNSKWDDFYEFSFKHASKKIKTFEKEIEIDEEISLEIIDERLLDELEIMEPFGVGNPAPKFLIKNLKILFIKILNEKHLKFKFIDEFKNEIIGIFWNAYDLKIYEDLQKNIDSSFSIISSIKKNKFNSKIEMQLIIEDIKKEMKI